MSAIITITGPSCAGKSTLEKMLIREPGFSRITSHTTRKPRPGEITEGKDAAYHFVDVDSFNAMAARHEFVERIEFGGNFYGAHKGEFAKVTHGENLVVVVDPNGRDEIIQYADRNGLPVLPVFITNPSNVIAARFLDRCFSDFVLKLATPGAAEESLKVSATRLDMMLSEEIHWRGADYPTAVTFGRFDKENEKLVLGRVMQLAAAL